MRTGQAHTAAWIALAMMGLAAGTARAAALDDPAGGTVMVYCNTTETGDGYSLYYSGEYILSDGKLAPFSSDQPVTVTLYPTSKSANAPYKLVRDSAGPNWVPFLRLQPGVAASSWSSTSRVEVEFRAPLYIPDSVFQSESGGDRNRGRGRGRFAMQAALRPIGASAAVDTTQAEVRGQDSDESFFMLTGAFRRDAADNMTGPVELTLSRDDRRAATYRYDLSRVPWQGFGDRISRQLADARNVKVKSDGGTSIAMCDTGTVIRFKK